MHWRKHLGDMKNQIVPWVEKAATSPTTQRTIARLDDASSFMTNRHYESANPVIAATRMPLVMGLWIMLALVCVILVWGSLAPIESAAVARGKVVLLSNKKTIQHLEGGIIESLMVKEGERVDAGQTLVKLSDTAATASRDALQGQLYVARATQARLIAERDDKEEIAFDQDMIDASAQNEELAKVIAAQIRLFESQRAANQAKLAIFQKRIDQSTEETEGFKSQSDSSSEQLTLLAEEIATTEKLLEQGLATRPHLLELLRRQSELTGGRGQYQAEISKVGQSIAETEMAILNEQKEIETKNSQELRDAQAQVAELQEKLRAAQDIVDRTVIAAPVGGIVTGLKYHTLGGVIPPGSQVMDIIPQDDQLVIEAQVKPNDIANVHSGLDANIVFTAYKMRSTPKVPGKVMQVSADTFTEENVLQPNSYYTAQIAVDKDFLRSLSHEIKLYPGMPADVLISTGSRSFLGYLFDPITDSMRRAFREE
jgi:HlyD family type I secretion membrane fusion protein